MLYCIGSDWLGRYSVEPDNFYEGESDLVLAKELDITKRKFQNGMSKFNGVRNNGDGPTFFRSPMDAALAIEWMESVKVANKLIKDNSKG